MSLFTDNLRRSLDPAARAEFRDVEAMILDRQMAAVGMREYPSVTGDPNGEWAHGECECDRCGQAFAVHPMDWRVIGYGNVPFLNVLCDGRRVKL